MSGIVGIGGWARGWLIAVVAMGGACGDAADNRASAGEEGGPGLTAADDGSGGAPTSGVGTAGASEGTAADDTDDGTGAEADIVEVHIVPDTAFLEVMDGVTPPPLALQAIGTTAQGDEVELAGVWNVDRLDVVGIDASSGELSVSGVAGGVATISFTSQAGDAESTATVKLHYTDDGGVDDATKMMFGAGGLPDPTLELLYPYEGTVFPLDLVPPVFQWNGGSAVDTYYLHLEAPTFEYEGWFTGVDPGRATLPTVPVDLWHKLTASVATKDIDVSLQRYDGAAVYQPVTSNFHIADAELIGTIYYWEVNNGNVVRLKVGDPAPEAFLQKPPGVTCVACHSVSADGSTLVAAFHGGYSPWGTFDAADGASLYATDTSSGFEAISPTGDYIVWGQTNGVANLSPFDGVNVLASLPVAGGFPAFPAWSPDGDMLAYSVRTDGNWLDFNNSTLWVSDVDLVTPGFSNEHELVAATPSRTAVTYPTWSPDSAWLAFGRATQARTRGAQGELGLMKLDGSVELSLDKGCGVGVLPGDQGSACYEPTFMPESRGGYFWLVFVSERTYGNTLVDTDPNTRHKQLWVTAIDDPPQAGQDPSHPAFWLPGQELDNQNMRGAWTLEPPDIAG